MPSLISSVNGGGLATQAATPGAAAKPLVLVRGTGEIGSAIACQALRYGLAVVIHDRHAPVSCRRGMSFVDAIFDGACALAGIKAQRVESLDSLRRLLQEGKTVPIVQEDFEAWLSRLAPDVIVDARMLKHRQPEPIRDWAPLTIGVGPNFIAGSTVHAVIESAWGPALGQVLWQGTAQPYTGEPRKIGAWGRERFVYAPCSGLFVSSYSINAVVTAGETIASLDGMPVRAPLSGRLRGLTRSGVRVEAGNKVIEVVPPYPRVPIFGLGERPLKIASGVIQALQRYPNSPS